MSKVAGPKLGWIQPAEQREARIGVLALRFLLLASAAAMVLIEHGFRVHWERWASILMHIGQFALIALYTFDIHRQIRASRTVLPGNEPDWADGILLGVGFFGALVAVTETTANAVTGEGIEIRRRIFLLVMTAALMFISTRMYRGMRRQTRYGLRVAVVAVGAALSWSLLHKVPLPFGWRIFEGSIVLLAIAELWRFNIGVVHVVRRPALLLPGSFLSLIAVGTPLLMVPLATPDGKSISFVDALFTMTSAVCVTGLIVKDTATDFTWFGQTIICIFVQLGGLGIIIFGSTLAMLLGSRLSLTSNITLSETLNDTPIARISQFARFVVLTTLALELTAAFAMMPLWDDPTLTTDQRFGQSLFHAISAFCNAGFSTLSDSLVGYRYAFLTHGIIAPLFIIGGIGFPVIDDLWRTARFRWQHRHPPGYFNRSETQSLAHKHLSLHSRLVLVTTATLYLAGVIGISAGQLAEHKTSRGSSGTVTNVLADASFQSLTARTAGFNSMPMEQIAPAGQLTIMALMMVGASPGGTGGGMKTTTVAVLIIAIFATARHRSVAEAFKRSIHDELVRRAGTLAISFVLLVTAATWLLTLTEKAELDVLAFEAISAATTTGLSLGVTPELTGFGKIVIIVTMFLGRVGPLALFAAMFFGKHRRALHTYPHESVLMG